MSGEGKALPPGALTEALRQLGEATAAKKCWSCGCLHGSLDSIEKAIPEDERPPNLTAALAAARKKLATVRYDCLGCEVCYPPLAMNALEIDAEACPAEKPETRDGWPPLLGSYTVLRYRAPVAICTLTDEKLAKEIASRVPAGVAMVGHVYTENLGIERIVQNVIANPHIRFLVVCGPDSRQAVGHLPGQSLVALAKNGLDDRGRIIGALGKRPVLKNVDRNAVEHFRNTIQVVDLVDTVQPGAILEAISTCAQRDPGPAAAPSSGLVLKPVKGYVPERMVSDPAGYFVVYADHARGLLSLEHYANTGVLDAVIEGATAAETYIPAVEKGLVSRLDHAAYLGKELARAERSLQKAQDAYVQDAAPELGSVVESQNFPPAEDCGCGPSATCSPASARKKTAMKPALLVALLVATVAVGGVVWAMKGAKPESAHMAKPAETPATGVQETILGVDELMHTVEQHSGSLTVEGVVSSVTTGSLSLIDVAEFKKCGVTTCAELVLPVRWTGDAPAAGQTVRVKGEVKNATDGGKLFFDAVAVSVVHTPGELK